MNQLTSRFLGAYGQLAVADTQLREQANQFLLQLVQTQEAWQVAKDLLMSSNHQERFLGAQLLYNKAQAAVFTLPTEQLKQLTGYTFGELQRQCSTASNSKQVLYMLQKAAAVCCICLNKYEPELLSKIVEFMKESPERMLVGATLLGEIADQIKKISNSSINSEVKAEFQQKWQEISVILTALLMQLREVPSKAEVALESIRTWIEMGMPLLGNHSLFQAVMSTYLNSQLCFEKCCDALLEDLKNIPRRKCSNDQTGYPTQNQIQSFTEMIQLLVITADQILNEEASRSHFAEMLAQLLQVFSIALMALPDAACQRMLNLMLKILQHSDMDTSHHAAQFWTDFYVAVKKADKKRCMDLRRLVEYYSKVYQCALEKCNLSKRPQNQEPESSIELELLEAAGSGDKGRMTFKQYRLFFVDLFQTVYKIFTEQCGTEQGNTYYFAPVFELLRNSMNSEQGEHQVELALFLTKSVNELCLEEGKKSIAAVLSCIPSLKGEQVHREALKLLVVCCRQIAKCPVLRQQLSRYIISSLACPAVSSYASYAFVSLVECISGHNMQELADSLLKIYMSPVLETLSDETLNKFIAGHVEFIQAFKSLDLRARYISQFLDEVTKTMNDSFKTPISLKKIQSNLVRLCVVVETIDHSTSKSEQVAVYPFLHKVLHFVEIVLSMCGGLTYSQNNCIGISAKTTKLTVRLLGNESATPTMINILNESMKILSSNLLQNYNLMSVLSCVLDYQKTRVNIIDEWLQAYFQQFLGFVLEVIRTSAKLNPELIKAFYIVLQRVIVYLPQVLFNCTYKPAIEELCLTALELEDVHLTKQLIIFIEIYIDSAVTPFETERFIPRVVAMLFQALPHLNVNSFLNIGNLLRIYFKVMVPTNLEHFISSCTWLTASHQQVRMIAKMLEQSTKLPKLRNLKAVLSLLASLGKNSNRHEVFQSLNRIYETCYEQQPASD